MAVANTLAYYITATIMAVKSFIVQAPGQIRKMRKLKISRYLNGILWNGGMR